MAKLLKQGILENVPFWILAGIAVVMGIIAFFTPPWAEIHPSVIKFISWIFAFTALWTVFVAMMRGIDATIIHGNTSLTVGNNDKPTDRPTELEQTRRGGTGR